VAILDFYKKLLQLYNRKKIEKIFCIKFYNAAYPPKSLFVTLKKLKYFFSLNGIHPKKQPNNQQTLTMSAMKINASTESAILTMLTSQQERLVTVLAEKYGFEVDEAIEHLGEPTAVERKEVKPRKPKEPKQSEDEPKSKGKGKAKAAKDDEDGEAKPKKAKTGYLLFCDAARASARDIKEREVETGWNAISGEPSGLEKVLAKHVVTLLAAAWKELDDDEQAVWKARAESLKNGEELEPLEVDLTDMERHEVPDEADLQI